MKKRNFILIQSVHLPPLKFGGFLTFEDNANDLKGIIHYGDKEKFQTLGPAIIEKLIKHHAEYFIELNIYTRKVKK